MIWDERLDENLRKVDAYNDGKTEGIEQTKKEIILSLHQSQVSVDIIAKSSGLTVDEVNEIIKNN